MAKPVIIELFDVAGRPSHSAPLTIVVPMPPGLSKGQRRAFGDGASAATDRILRALRTVPKEDK